MTAKTDPKTDSKTEKQSLDPDYRLAGAIVMLSLPLSLISPWITVVVLAFGCFLITQAASLRLVFADASLQVYRLEAQIRDFPYADWTNWRIFYPSLPILFYFREVRSIHFLPILFDPAQLKHRLDAQVGDPALLNAQKGSAQEDPEADNTAAKTADGHLDPAS
jgi:hypothetical protein